jgi:hypothetical protein
VVESERERVVFLGQQNKPLLVPSGSTLKQGAELLIIMPNSAVWKKVHCTTTELKESLLEKKLFVQHSKHTYLEYAHALQTFSTGLMQSVQYCINNTTSRKWKV